MENYEQTHGSETGAEDLKRMLVESGIASEVPDPTPNHDITALQAYLLCYPGCQKRDFDELKASLSPPYAPLSAYYRKMWDICRRVIYRELVQGEFRERVMAAANHFEALVDMEVERAKSVNVASASLGCLPMDGAE